MNKMLAKITKASLEIKERGVLNFWIYVNYEDGMSQGVGGVGGIVLDEYDKDNECRIGTAYGCEMIRQLLISLDVNDFSEMSGLHVWVYGDGDGFSFKPKGISRLSLDHKCNPVIFDEIAKLFKVGDNE